MNDRIVPLDELSTAVPSSRLFVDWLEGQLPEGLFVKERPGATAELREALADAREHETTSSRFFVHGGPPLWRASLAEDLWCEDDRRVFAEQCAGLSDGRLGVVVTGQQPGWLGGPLYTLHKIATAIALAEKLTRGGKPTVPIFWSGDDDDDLAEALAPVGWEPDRGAFTVKDTGKARQSRTMVGTQITGRWDAAGGAWLKAQAAQGDPWAVDLAGIWQECQDKEWPWARLQQKILLRVFAGRGLIILSGNDPQLHGLAAPFYETWRQASAGLPEQAGDRGRRFAEGRWHAQIADRSLARPLFVSSAAGRSALDPKADWPAPEFLRPGVMLRSPLQDWLLNPRAVVVGPAELAYLRQLDPVYTALGVPRSPLVPRLFAWLLPPGFSPNILREFRNPSGPTTADADRWATDLAKEAENSLADLLMRELGIPEERARHLATARSKRWRKGLAAMLTSETEQSRRAQVALDPPWVFPEGKRQERHLAFLNAASLWGEALIEDLLAAAAAHLDAGLAADWREFAVTVADPGVMKG